MVDIDGSDLPWFPLYVRRFTDSRFVKMADASTIGCYTLLLCEQWKNGPLPDDTDAMAALCGCHPDAMAEAWSQLQDKYVQVEGGWVDPVLEEVRDEQEAKREQKAAAGRKGAKARWENGTASGDANGTANGTANDSADATAMQDVEEDKEVDVDVEVETTDSDESELRSLADLGRDPPGDDDTRKEVTDALVKAWLSLQPERPPEKQIGKQGAVAKRLAEDTAPRKLAIALYGMEQLWEHREAGNPWDLFDFEKKLSKALKRGVESMRNGGGSAADQKLEQRKRDTLEAIS